MLIFLIRETGLHKSCIFGLSNTVLLKISTVQISHHQVRHGYTKRSGPPKHAEVLNKPNIPDVQSCVYRIIERNI